MAALHVLVLITFDEALYLDRVMAWRLYSEVACGFLCSKPAAVSLRVRADRRDQLVFRLAADKQVVG